MELMKQSFGTKVKNLVGKIYDDNLFLLASSISYYSALALAPFLLILLAVASLIGGGTQNKLTNLAFDFSPELGRMISIIFSNVNEGVNIGSVSGLIGVLILLWTSSLVFLQLRYSLDVIYGHHASSENATLWGFVSERLFAMFVVILAGLFFIASSSLPGIVDFIFRGRSELYPFLRLGAFFVNFLIFVLLFWGIHFIAPTKRPKKRDAFKMALFSALFFIVGNVLFSGYLKGVASSSIYGAAGTLLIFLMWTYYSSFTLFLSVEIFLYLKKLGKLK
jgi:membrane protein